jgi:uncharacterized protein
MADYIIWADIPVIDMKRAAKFYGDVLQVPVNVMPGTNDTVAVIGSGTPDNPSISADLYVGGTPSHDGPTIYVTPGDDLDATIARVEPAGGKILQEKKFMGDVVGWIAFFEDSEGNRIGVQKPA